MPFAKRFWHEYLDLLTDEITSLVPKHLNSPLVHVPDPALLVSDNNRNRALIETPRAPKHQGCRVYGSCVEPIAYLAMSLVSAGKESVCQEGRNIS